MQFPLLSVLCFLIVVFSCSITASPVGDEPVSGGVETVANNDPNMLAALAGALDQIRAKFPAESSVELGNVKSAKLQVVAGNRWEIELELKTKACKEESCLEKAQNCSLTIFSQPWLGVHDLITFECSSG